MTASGPLKGSGFCCYPGGQGDRLSVCGEDEKGQKAQLPYHTATHRDRDKSPEGKSPGEWLLLSVLTGLVYSLAVPKGVPCKT